jgi:hypothetical protein
MTHEDEPWMTSQLQAYWLRSCRSAPPESSAQVFVQVLARWSEPQRAYHTASICLKP